MSIDLVNSGDGWFNRAGALGGGFNYVASLYGSANDTAFQNVWSLFATSDQAAVQSLPDDLAGWRTTGQAYCSVLSTDGQLASVLQVNRAFPLVPLTFVQSVQRVRAQMVATAQTIKRPTITSTVTAGGSNLGNTEIFVSNTNIYGDPLDTTYDETQTATCTSQGSGFSGTIGVVGEPTVPTYSYLWPMGSGTSTALSIQNPATDGTITNSALDTFTVANTPDDWTILNGAAGTTVFSSSGGGVRGDDCVYLQSNGSSATQLSQEVTGLTTNTVYAVTFQAKMNANSASGNLVVQLYDPDAGAVIANDAGTDLSATYALNGGAGELTTSYQLLTVFFSTPRQLPSTIQLRIGYGTAGVSTRQLFLCNVQVYAATALYGPSGTGTAGPFAVAVSNTLPSAVNDTWSIVFTNDYGNPPGGTTFCWVLQRLYDFRSLGLYLPSATSPSNTISDGLILPP